MRPLNWILCQLWLSTINTINNRKKIDDYTHAKQVATTERMRCPQAAALAPSLPPLCASQTGLSLHSAQPLLALALLRSAALSASLSLSLSEAKHSSLAAQVLGLKTALPAATSTALPALTARLWPVFTFFLLLQAWIAHAATSIYEKLLSSRGRRTKWVDIAIAIDVGFNVVSVCLLLLQKK